MGHQKWYKEVSNQGILAIAAGVDIQERGRASLAPCPACNAETRGEGERRGPIGYKNGGWQCHRCSATGDGADLLAYRVAGVRLRECDPGQKDRVRARGVELGFCDPYEDAGASNRRRAPRRPVRPKQTGSRRAVAIRVTADGQSEGKSFEPAEAPQGGGDFAWDPTLQDRAHKTLMTDPEASDVLDYLLTTRNLSAECLERWHIGAFRARSPRDKIERWWVVIPLWTPEGEVVNYKFRVVPKDEQDRPRPKYMTCSGRPMPLFGAAALGHDLSEPVIICEGELDVLAMWCLGWERSVVSGTTGDSWDEAWLDALEPYSGFVLMHDQDEAGEGAIPKVAASLGAHRCVRARLPAPHKDAGAVLAAGLGNETIELALDQAEPLVKMRVVRPSSFQDKIEKKIVDPTERWKRQGLPTGSVSLDEMLGGWPVGVTVITGHSGSGKTSFADWAAYVQCLEGVDVMLTSFENSPEDAAENLLRMHLGGNPEGFSVTERREAWGEVDQMNVHLVQHQGFTAVDELFETMEFAVRRLRTRFIVIDHLGYMIDMSARENPVQQLDRITKRFASFAMVNEVVILLIVHPDKQHRIQGRRATIGDAKGSISIEQEAVGGLSLSIDDNSTLPRVVIQVDKWRPKTGEGRGAQRPLFYDPEANRYAEVWEDLPISSD